MRFSARVAGPVDGEPVLLLHGFPDSAASFDHQLAALADAGYRAIAPTMRGYEPSSQPDDGDYDLMTLADDVVGWLDDLGIERAHAVGHDWGAAVTYVLAARYPDRLLTACAMAVPPLTRLTAALRHVPRQLVLSWYMTFFQLRGIADLAVRARDHALIRWFWPRWSPGLAAPQHVLETFARPGVGRAALAYYRHNATPLKLLGITASAATEPLPFRVPMLLMHGDRDGCMDARLFDHAIVADDYPSGVTHRTIEGVGHFLHLEAPDTINEILIDWLDEGYRER